MQSAPSKVLPIKHSLINYRAKRLPSIRGLNSSHAYGLTGAGTPSGMPPTVPSGQNGSDKIRIVNFEGLPEIFQNNPYLKACLNRECPRVTGRLSNIMRQILQHPRFQGYRDDIALFLMDDSENASISFPQAGSFFNYTACFYPIDYLHTLLKNEGDLCDDQIAFHLTHELVHYLRRKENIKRELSYEEERRCDAEALTIMDEVGYSVHFASFTATFGTQIQDSLTMSSSHPDLFWRQTHLEERLRKRHFLNYSETSRFAFDEASLVEVSSDRRITVKKKKAEKQFHASNYENYVDQIGRIDSADELMLHLSNLFLHFVRTAICHPAFDPNLRKMAVHHYYTFIGNEAHKSTVFSADQVYVDLDRDYSYLDCVDLSRFQDEVNRLVSNDENFEAYELSSDPAVNAKQRKQISEIWVKLKIFKSVSAGVFSEVLASSDEDFFDVHFKAFGVDEKGHRGYLGPIKGDPRLAAMAQDFYTKMDQLFSLATQGNPSLAPLASLICHVARGTPLQFSSAELIAFLDSWPALHASKSSSSEDFYGQHLSDRAYAVLSHKITQNLCGFGRIVYWPIPDRGQAIVAQALLDSQNDLDFYLEVRKRFFAAALDCNASVRNLTKFRGVQTSEWFDDLIWQGIRLHCPRGQIEERILSLIERVKEKKRQGKDYTEELADIVFLNPNNGILLKHFEFFEEFLFATYGEKLLSLSLVKEFCLPPEWAKSEESKKLSNFLAFIDRPEFSTYKTVYNKKGFFDDFFSCWTQIYDQTEREHLLQLFWARFADLSSLGRSFDLYCFLRLIEDGEEVIALTRGGRGPAPYRGRYFSGYLDQPHAALPRLDFSIRNSFTAPLSPKQLNQERCRKAGDFINRWGFNRYSKNELREVIDKLQRRIAASDRREHTLEEYLHLFQFMYLRERVDLSRDEDWLLYRECLKPLTYAAYDHEFSCQLATDSKEAKAIDENYVATLNSALAKVRATLDPVEQLHCLPAHLALCMARKTIGTQRPQREKLAAACRGLRDKSIVVYEDESMLHPSKRLDSRLSYGVVVLGDYISYLLFLETVKTGIETCAELVDHLGSAWTTPSAMRDIAIIEFLEKTPHSIDDLISLAPHFKRPERAAELFHGAYTDWLSENEAAPFAEKVRVITGLFPEKSPNRDTLILNTAREYPIDLARFREVEGLLLEDAAATKSAMIEEHGIQLALASYSAQEKKELLLWIIGFRSEPPEKFKKHCEKRRVDPEWIKESLILPDERERFLKSILSGADGLCVDQNRTTKAELLEDIFAHLFGAQRSQRENFVLDLAKIVFEELAIFKQYVLFEALINRLYEDSDNGGKTSLENIVRLLLENIGPEGVKLAQILSSYQALWQAEPELARALSDLQDESSLVHHYYCFKHLLFDFGGARVANLTLQPPKKAGSIKGFFVAQEEGKYPFGLLYLRPQVNKFIDRSEEEMARILERAVPVVAAYYGGKIPPHIPELVSALIRREVDFEGERDALVYCRDTRDETFGYPRPLPEWQSPTVIGETYISPHISFKRLLALEGSTSEWEKCSDEEKEQVCQLMGWQDGAAFDQREFSARLHHLKAKVQRGLLTHLVAGERFHLDPHPGNILAQVEDGNLQPILTDLGSMISLGEAERKFLAGSLLALATGQASLLSGATNQYFGQETELASAEVLSVDLKSRPVRLLENLDDLGLDVPLVAREFLLAISKADPILEIYSENISFYSKMIQQLNP